LFGRFLLRGGLLLLGFFAHLADCAAKTAGQFLKRDAHVARNGRFDDLTDVGIDFDAFCTGVGKAKTGLVSLFFAGFSGLFAVFRFEPNLFLLPGGLELFEHIDAFIHAALVLCLIADEKSELSFVFDAASVVLKIEAVGLEIDTALTGLHVLGQAVDVGLLDEVDGLLVGAEVVLEGNEGFGIFPRHDLEGAGETVVAAVLGRDGFACGAGRPG